jgi:chondroitin sulfate proteoglycan 4
MTFDFGRANLPTRFHELNIHFGIWLGGLAGFNEIFLGNLPSFRGCMEMVKYNTEDVLLRAKTHAGQVSHLLSHFHS